MRSFKLWKAGTLAFILGVPMAAEAKAQDAFGVVDAALYLFFSIADLAGDS